MFVPALFPIEGRYNDYGSLEDIVRTKNTELIENMFGMKIEQFVDDIASVREEENVLMDQRKFVMNHEDHMKSEWVTEPTPLSGCFIHKFAYEEAYSYCLKTDCSYANSFSVTSELLEWAGFNEPEKDESLDRYSYVYRIPGISYYVIQSDGT